jgi:polar amino acid transport system substrate-binding protein
MHLRLNPLTKKGIMKSEKTDLNIARKNTRRVLIISIFALMFCSVWSLSVSAVQKLTLSVPNIQSPEVAIAEQVLSKAYQELGIEIVLKKLPGKRALAFSNEGKTDGELLRVAQVGKMFPNLIIIPVAVVSMEISVFTKGKTFTVNGWSSLKPFKIGVVRAIAITDKATEKMNRQMLNQPLQLFKVLDIGRVDVAAFLKRSGVWFLSQHPEFKGVTVLEPPLLKLPTYHFLHNKNRNLIPKITAVLKKMEEDGTIRKMGDQIFAKMLKGK